MREIESGKARIKECRRDALMVTHSVPISQEAYPGQVDGESDNSSSTAPINSRSVSMTSWALYTPRRRWGLLSILFLVTTSNYFDYYVISVVLEPIKREFHVSDTML